MDFIMNFIKKLGGARFPSTSSVKLNRLQNKSIPGREDPLPDILPGIVHILYLFPIAFFTFSFV